MSCKKDRDLQAAIAMGLLWGMSQTPGGAQGLSIPERAERLKILIDYIGIRLPVSSVGDSILIGSSVLKQIEGKWVATIKSQDETTQTDMPWGSYAHAIRYILQTEAERETRKAVAGIAFPMEKPTIAQLEAWAAQCHAALTKEGGLFEHAPMTIQPHKSTYSDHVMIDTTLLMSEDSTDSFANVTAWGDDPYGSLPSAFSKLMDRAMDSIKRLEPVLGVLDKVNYPGDLLNNGYLRVVYVDAGTASTLGETVKKGWYVLRDGHPYHGPLPSPLAASKWIGNEWGMDVEKYGYIAKANDQYRAIRNKFVMEAEKIKQSKLPEKAQEAAFKQLASQMEFAVGNMVAPYVVSMQDGTDYKKSGKRFFIQGADGCMFKVSISPPTKSSPSQKWNIRKINPSGTTSSYRSGNRSSVSSLKDPANLNTMQDALFETIRILIADGQIEAKNR